MSPSTSEASGRWGRVLRWRETLRARLARPRLLWLDASGADALAALEARPGQALDLVVSERQLQHLVCEPGLPLADAAALQAYARQLLAHYFGAAAQRWPLAPWRAGAAAGASALQGLDPAALRAALEARHCRLHGLRPAWAALLQALAPQQPDWAAAQQAALAWVEGPLLTWLVLERGQVQLLRHQRLAAPSVEALLEALAALQPSAQRPTLLLGYGLDAPQLSALPGLRQLAPLDGRAPLPAWFERPGRAAAARLPRPDFASGAGPQRPSGLAWALALCGALVLATAAWSAVERQQDLQRARAQLAALQRQQPGGPARSAPPAADARQARAANAQAQERQRALAEVQALLAHRWGPLLANVEQAGEAEAPAALAWLGMDYTVARRELRLEGLASDQALALGLVERLAAAPGWGEVVLSRFQKNEAAGAAQQRFELAARLRPELLEAALARVSQSKEAVR